MCICFTSNKFKWFCLTNNPRNINLSRKQNRILQMFISFCSLFIWKTNRIVLSLTLLETPMLTIWFFRRMGKCTKTREDVWQMFEGVMKHINKFKISTDPSLARFYSTYHFLYNTATAMFQAVTEHKESRYQGPTGLK